MELIISGNPNLATIRSVIFFANHIYEAHIDRVHFLDTIDTIQIKGESIEGKRNEIVRNYIPRATILSSPIEKNDMHIDIPHILSEELKLYKSDQIIIDLTNGNKYISNILYASASLSKITNLFFLLVNRDKQGELPETLSTDDYAIENVRGLENVHNIGQHSYFEIIYYQETADELAKDFDAYDYKRFNNFSFETELHTAIRSYFRSEFKNTISCIGTIAEFIAYEVCARIKNKAKGALIDQVAKDFASDITWLKANFCDNLRGKKGIDLDEYQKQNEILQNLDVIFDVIRVHRNLTAHPYTILQGRDEARLLIYTLFYMLKLIIESKILQ